MAVTQMNVRLEEDVKAVGDAAFGKIGYTPSRVVRAIWGYAARCEAAPEEVENLLRETEGLDAHEDEKLYLCQADFKRVLREAFGQAAESQVAAAQVGAWANVEHLLDLATVVGSDHGDAHIALKDRSIHGDFEDDLVIAATLRSSADCLVTSDEKLRRHSPVLTLNATEAIAYFGLAA